MTINLFTYIRCVCGFNTYNSFLLITVQAGTAINNNYNNIIGQIPIPPNSLGTLINFEAEPKYIFAMCDYLIGIKYDLKELMRIY
jgi:hypothetical protein